MKSRSLILRKTSDRAVKTISVLAALFGVFFLAWIMFTVLKFGFKSFSLSFLIEPTKPYGVADGGIANALLGTLLITFGASALGVPLGLLG